MQNSGIKSMRFNLTEPDACPYIDGEIEQKIYLKLDENTRHLHDMLNQYGFRRTQNYIYRPHCPHCTACMSMRIPVAHFTLSKSLRRVSNKNKDLHKSTKTYGTPEQFDLLNTYLNARHYNAGMNDITLDSYYNMIKGHSGLTQLTEYRSEDGTLRACALVDYLADGMSMVYSFFDPNFSKRSCGTFMILDHLQTCSQQALSYLYLGYWVDNSHKMAYKLRFKPLEIFNNNKWGLVE